MSAMASIQTIGRAVRTAPLMFIALCACSNDAPQAPGEESQQLGAKSSTSGSSSVDEFARLFVSHSDYVPAETPQALADTSELVVTGEIVDALPGRTFGKSLDDPSAREMITLVVNVTDEITSAADPSVAYVELNVTAGQTASDVKNRLPVGTKSAFFLRSAPSAIHQPIVDDQAGRPAGFPLYVPAGPEGFLLEAEGGVLEPMLENKLEGASLPELLPSATD